MEYISENHIPSARQYGSMIHTDSIDTTTAPDDPTPVPQRVCSCTPTFLRTVLCTPYTILHPTVPGPSYIPVSLLAEPRTSTLRVLSRRWDDPFPWVQRAIIWRVRVRLKGGETGQGQRSRRSS
jgi:hypothetical protein